jgi:long-chain acyl-CoA synthetase
VHRYARAVDSSRTVNPISYLERNAEVAPSGAFLISARQTLTNSQALTNVKKIAYELRRLGIKPGDMVALDLPEALSILFAEALFHEAAASTVLPAGYVADGSFTIDWLVSNAASPTPAGNSRVIAVDDHFLEQIEQNPYGIRSRDYESDNSLMWVIFSSGTTGKPNAIPATLGQLDDYAATAPDPWTKGGNFVSFLGAKTPMGMFAFYMSVKNRIPFLSIGDNIPNETVELIARNGAQTLAMSPAQVAAFVGELEAQNRTLPQVQTVYTVGMAMSPELSARMRAVSEGCEIYTVYGSTEAGTASLRNYETDDPFDAGQLVDGVDIQIVNDDGEVLPEGEVGRIRHHSSFMAHQYLGDPEGTEESFKEGWFYPGDLGAIRPDNGLTLAGRTSEILNAGGVKVNPTRLDLFAVAYPKVVDAASFGYLTAAGIQQIGIALVTDDGLDVDALNRAFDQEFGPAAPKLVARVDGIPRNAMGKPMRLTLAEKYRKS